MKLIFKIEDKKLNERVDLIIEKRIATIFSNCRNAMNRRIEAMLPPAGTDELRQLIQEEVRAQLSKRRNG